MFLKNPFTAGTQIENNRTMLTKGELPDHAFPIVEGLLQGVISSKEPVILGDVGGGPSALPEPLSLAAVPLLLAEQEALGVVLVGNRKTRRINQRQLALLQTIAGQVVLVVQNSRLMAELEYKTLIEERSRLARES
jgi:GAF domain-containing protein